MDRFEQRWQQRRVGAPQEMAQAMVTVTVSEQVTVMVNPEGLWRLVWDPATSPLVLDHVVSAFTLPGSPCGQVGEMQMSVVACKDGTLIGMVEEVVELGPGYRAVTRSRSTTQPSTSTTLVLPLDLGGCVLRYRTEQIVPAPAENATREACQEHLRLYLARVRDLAEASQQPPAQKPPA